jgi:hypothetical protein
MTGVDESPARLQHCMQAMKAVAAPCNGQARTLPVWGAAGAASSFFCAALVLKKAIKAATRIMATSDPPTPPAIAPTFDFFFAVEPDEDSPVDVACLGDTFAGELGFNAAGAGARGDNCAGGLELNPVALGRTPLCGAALGGADSSGGSDAASATPLKFSRCHVHRCRMQGLYDIVKYTTCMGAFSYLLHGKPKLP